MNVVAKSSDRHFCVDVDVAVAMQVDMVDTSAFCSNRIAECLASRQ
jgi:hypothetical protein